MRRQAKSFGLMIAMILLVVSTSFAHAKLVSSTPSAGQNVPVAPSSVSLQFSVRVQSKMSSIVVTDPAGGSVTAGAIAESDEGKLVSLSLPPLGDGSYRVEWRALSADDHMIEGSFEFSVGDRSQAAPVAETNADHSGMDHSAHESTPTNTWSQSLVRWLIYMGMMMLTGGLGFRLFVISGGNANAEEFDARLTKLFTYTSLLIVCSLLTALVLQTQLVTGSFGSSQAASILSATSFGPPWLLQLLAAIASLFLMLGATGRHANSRNVLFWITFALSVAALLGPSLSGHARAAWDEYSLAIVSDWLHLVAGSLWIGGLAMVAITLANARAASDRKAARNFVYLIIKTFTRIAIPIIILLVITGLYNTWMHVESLSALTGTTYGLVLLVKGAISGLMIVLGGINAFVLVPGLIVESAGDPVAKRLTASIKFEILLAIIVLLLAAILAFLPPAREHKPIAGGVARGIPEAI